MIGVLSVKRGYHHCRSAPLQGGKVCHAFVNKRKDRDMEKFSMKESVSGLPVILFLSTLSADWA
jgi:hypothetical protein